MKRLALSWVAVLALGAPAEAQSIVIEKAEVLTGAGGTAVRFVASLDLAPGTVVVAEARRPGVTVIGKHTLQGSGKNILEFGPFDKPADPGIYILALVARKADQTDGSVRKAWTEEVPDPIEGSFNLLVGDGQAAEQILTDTRKKYTDLLYRYAKWYQLMTARVEGAILRAKEVEAMSKSDPMKLEHFRKTMWSATKRESDTGENLLKPIHHDLLLLTKEEAKSFAPTFGPMCGRIAGAEKILEEWFGGIMREAQTVYEQLYPPGERQLKTSPEDAGKARREIETRVTAAAEAIYQTLQFDIHAAWLMKEIPTIDRGHVDKGLYENQSCRFVYGPLPPGFRFNLFTPDASVRVFVEPTNDAKTGKPATHLEGFQGSVVVQQHVQPLAPDAFALLLTSNTNSGYSHGKEFDLPDVTMPGRKRHVYSFELSTKIAGTPARPAGEYQGMTWLVFGRDRRTIYVVQMSAQKKHWDRVQLLVEEMWKTFKVRDEDPPDLIRLVPR